MRILLIILIVLLFISGCGMTQSPTASEIVLIIPTPSEATTVHINTPTTALAEEAEAITVTPEPEHEHEHEHESEPEPEPEMEMEMEPKPESEHEFLLGVTDRGMNCPLISQIVAHVLAEEAGLSVGIIDYESPDALFASLADSDQKEIDLTLCFLDPDDRDYLKLYPTDLKQIGESIWHAKDSAEKLLIMVNSSNFVNIHEQHCPHDILHRLLFDDASFEEQNVEAWIERHSAQVDSWGSCH